MGIRDSFDMSRESFAASMKKVQPILPLIKGFLIYGLYLATVSVAVTGFRSKLGAELSGVSYGKLVVSLSCLVFTAAILYSGMLTFALHSKSEREDFVQRNPVEFDPRAEKTYILHSAFFWKELTVIGVLLLLHPLEWTHGVLFQFHPIAEGLPYLVKKLIVFALYGALSIRMSLSAKMEARKAWGVISKDLYKERLWKSIKDKKERRFGYGRMLRRILFNFVIYLLGGAYLPYALVLVFSIVGIAHLLLTVSGSAIAILVIFIGAFYLRAILKRAKFIRRLRACCAENGYELFDMKRPYRSIFRDAAGYTFGIEGKGKTYYCRLIASVKRGNDITFSHDGHCHRTFVLRLPVPRVSVRGRIVNNDQSSEAHGYEIAKFSSEIDYTFSSGEGTKIVIVNPVSAKMYFEKMGRVTDLDHGMSIGEYKIFTASSFIYALELDCADKMDPKC